jgi:hypothetical protein
VTERGPDRRALSRNDGPTFHACDVCGAEEAVYLPPWARRPDLVWGVVVLDDDTMWIGTGYCTFCKAKVSYAVPRPL